MVDVVARKRIGDLPPHGDIVWRKRQAIQIAAQLPEDQEAALAVLEYARGLVVGFLGKND